MDINRLSELRPRFLWDIVDDAFDLYRERFTMLLGVGAVLSIPSLLLTDLSYDLWIRPIVNTSDRFGIWGLFLLFLWLPVEAVLATFRMGAVAAVVDAQLHGRPLTTIGTAYRATMRHWASLLGVGALAALIAILLTCLSFGIGTIWFAVVAAFIAPAVVLENRRPIGALKRSRALAGSDQGRVFGAIVLLGGITLCLSLGMEIIVQLVFQLIPMGDTTAALRETQKSLTDQAVVGLIGIALQPLLSIALTLLYFDLRVRRQGIDLAAQAEEHGVALAPDPFGDVNSDRVVLDQLRKRKRGEGRARRGGATT